MITTPTGFEGKSEKIQRTWLMCDFTWGNPPDPFTWDDVWLIIEAGNVIIGSDKSKWKNWQKENKEKKKKLIKLICIVKGERFVESKYVKETEIDIKDVELLVEKALNKKIDISFNN